jgi:hypothetical protein
VMSSSEEPCLARCNCGNVMVETSDAVDFKDARDSLLRENRGLSERFQTRYF